MEIRALAAAEVVDVTTRLRADSPCVLAPTVPLQVKCDLAIRQQIASPPIRWWAAIPLACRSTRPLTEPVVQTLVGQVTRRRRQLRIEAIGGEVVPKVVGLLPCTASA